MGRGNPEKKTWSDAENAVLGGCETTLGLDCHAALAMTKTILLGWIASHYLPVVPAPWDGARNDVENFWQML